MLERRLLDTLLDRWEAAWSGRDGQAFAPLCVTSVQYEDPLTPEPLIGAAAIAAHAQRLWTGFPDVRMQSAGQRLQGERFIAAPVKVSGTHSERLGDIPATNRPLIAHGVFYCELEHDLLLRVRGFYDVWGSAVDLGVLPKSGTASARALFMLRGFGLRGGRD
ncbi:MAG: ester cyclase [Solirubrobacterales bacterium]|nr:ester cyclase [Solirubrobacterales bacterium]